MKELVEVIAKSLVDYPDEVQVTETENDKAVVLELKVAQSDMGMENYDRIISGGCHYPDTWDPWRGQSISNDR